MTDETDETDETVTIAKAHQAKAYLESTIAKLCDVFAQEVGVEISGIYVSLTSDQTYKISVTATL